MHCHLNNTFSWYLTFWSDMYKNHGSQLMHNLPNSPRQYNKHQTRVEEIEKCLDEGLEPTYCFSIFKMVLAKSKSYILNHATPQPKKA